jgi:hypothetical protein
MPAFIIFALPLLRLRQLDRRLFCLALQLGIKQLQFLCYQDKVLMLAPID